MAGAEYTIRKIKLAGSVHTWRASLVDEDEHGRWLFTPNRGAVHNCKDGAEWESEMGLGTEPGFLWLMPRDDWWFGAWWTRSDRDQISIDACTPPTLIDGIWTWTDLELDIARNDKDGQVWVEDEDEFADSVALGLVDEPTQQAAWEVTTRMVELLTQRAAPFDDSGWQRFRAAVAAGR